MKPILSIIITLVTLSVRAQTVTELQKALITPSKAVQAIHGYPASTYHGQCHWVPITDIKVSGNNIAITETWTGATGKETTTLVGSPRGTSVDGTWSSDYSGGNWSYSFSASKGEWNKTKVSMFVELFKEYYNLRFRIVNKADLKDGPHDCN